MNPSVLPGYDTQPINLFFFFQTIESYYKRKYPILPPSKLLRFDRNFLTSICHFFPRLFPSRWSTVFPRFFPSEWTIESNAVRPSSSFQNRLRKGIKRERESYGEHEANIDRGEREKVREMRRRKERRRKEGRKVFSAVIIGDVSRVVPLGPRQKKRVPRFSIR